MIEAMPMILTAVPDAKYIIVGDGAYGDTLKQAAQEMAGESIIFTGTRQDIPELLAASDLFVLPTLQDALPTVLIEAMAAGKPIVASNVGGVPEIVDDGTTGLLVPAAEPEALAQASIQLLQDRDRRKEMGQTGQAVASQRFDIHTQVKRLGDMYEELLV
jgi:glycosyltransferase involved in cell wall biosynthesis